MFNKIDTHRRRSPLNCRRQTGTSLIEVLVTVVVTTIGLLGMGGVMIVSQRVSQDSYLRTQANIVAQTLIDSMSINRSAVADGDYDGPFDDVAIGPACETSACSPAERAHFDRARLTSSLKHSLPNASASLSCSRGDPSAIPGFDGLCRLQLDWSLRSLAADSQPSTQTQVWHFQP